VFGAIPRFLLIPIARKVLAGENQPVIVSSQK
jgi:hypothetical protein